MDNDHIPDSDASFALTSPFSSAKTIKWKLDALERFEQIGLKVLLERTRDHYLENN